MITILQSPEIGLHLLPSRSPFFTSDPAPLGETRTGILDRRHDHRHVYEGECRELGIIGIHFFFFLTIRQTPPEHLISVPFFGRMLTAAFFLAISLIFGSLPVFAASKRSLRCRKTWFPSFATSSICASVFAVPRLRSWASRLTRSSFRSRRTLVLMTGFTTGLGCFPGTGFSLSLSPSLNPLFIKVK